MDRTIKDNKEITSYTTASKCYVVYLTKFFVPDTTEVQIQKVFYSKQKATEYKELLKKRYDFTVEMFIEESEIEIWKQTE
jgi:thymidylate synthase ThyX